MSFDLDDDELKATRRMKKLDKMLEVGEYVRTTEGRIDKVKNLKFDDPQYIECEKGLTNDIKEILTKEQYEDNFYKVQ
jgi:hypothetical protein